MKIKVKGRKSSRYVLKLYAKREFTKKLPKYFYITLDLDTAERREKETLRLK